MQSFSLSLYLLNLQSCPDSMEKQGTSNCSQQIPKNVHVQIDSKSAILGLRAGFTET